MEEFRLDGLTVKEHLLILAEDGNRKFTEGLHPGVEHVLGIRLPALRKLAARIAKADWERYFDTADGFYMEERMLQGMVLGCIRPDEDVEVYLHRGLSTAGRCAIRLSLEEEKLLSAVTRRGFGNT